MATDDESLSDDSATDATPPLVPPPPDGPAKRSQAVVPSIPGYVIERELGRGGMGVVYLARSLALDRLCALKVILGGAHGGEDEVERFRKEARAIARVQHPGIVQVYEVGDHDGRPFMALEFCSGGSLDAKLSKNPLGPREAAALIQHLAEAVQAAHDVKVVHRDLKPGNVLLCNPPAHAGGSPALVPKVTDFGLAKRLDEQGQTQTGAIVGTPSYMAPEQATPDKDVGPLADVYALGAVLYECLSGRPPFKAATTYETLLQVVADEPVPLRQLNARTPRDLETIALRCLAKSPAKRYASARGLADDLGRFLAGEPIRARPVGPLERAAKGVRRHKTVSALVSLLFLALVVWGATATAQYLKVQFYAGVADDRAKEATRQERLAKEETRKTFVTSAPSILADDGMRRMALWFCYAIGVSGANDVARLHAQSAALALTSAGNPLAALGPLACAESLARQAPAPDAEAARRVRSPWPHRCSGRETFLPGLVGVLDDDEARFLLAGWMRDEPRNVAPYRLRAQLEFDRGDYDASLAWAERGLRLDADDDELLPMKRKSIRKRDEKRAASGRP